MTRMMDLNTSSATLQPHWGEQSMCWWVGLLFGGSLARLEIHADRNLMKFNHSTCKFFHLGYRYSIKHCRVGVGLASEQLCSKGLG